jgi:cysteine desulfurase
MIYFDYAATTPLAPTVLQAMLPYLGPEFGNPSSIYQLGQRARYAVDQSRSGIAGILGIDPAEVTFTSGSTESNNLALSGILWAARKRGIARPHVVTSAIEHSAILEHTAWLKSVGFAVTLVGCTKDGLIEQQAVSDAITADTALISIMYANNEVGSIQDLPAIGAIARSRGIPFHTDATQAAGLLPLTMDDLGVDLMSLSAHKFYGPKGVGILAARKSVPIDWQQHGGGQEGGRRGGTENVVGIVGFGAALVEAEGLRQSYSEHCRSMRDQLWVKLASSGSPVAINGPDFDGPRLANNLNLRLPGIQGETMLVNLDISDIAASAGSACSVGRNEPSHVLMAMGQSPEQARCALRLTVGRATSSDETTLAAEAILSSVARFDSINRAGSSIPSAPIPAP